MPWAREGQPGLGRIWDGGQSVVFGWVWMQKSPPGGRLGIFEGGSPAKVYRVARGHLGIGRGVRAQQDIAPCAISGADYAPVFGAVKALCF